MRSTILAVAFASLIGALPGIAGSALTLPSLTVGRNLQTSATITLAEPAPEIGVRFTVTSDDPSRLLLSAAPDQAGSSSISVTVNPNFRASREFWVHGLGDSGSVGYTVNAQGMDTTKGTVTLAPSAIVIIGPFRAPSFPTTPRGEVAKITLVSVALNSSKQVNQEQQVAGGTQVEVSISNSNPEVGKLADSKLRLTGGSSFAETQFQPVAVGNTTMAPVQPKGFTVPEQYAAVSAAVSEPGLGIVGEMFLGKNLQYTGILCLGEPAPPGGLKVTFKSADGSKLLVSPREDQVGSESLTITVPEGKSNANYYLQALGDSGIVTYEASAPKFRSRTARVGLTSSGVIVAYSHYGPPDEAAVLGKGALDDAREFFVSLADAKQHKVPVSVWTAYLDRETGRAADITVQPLRAGATATVVIKSSDPGVASVDSPVTIPSGKNHAMSQLRPQTKGKTVISVSTPSGFATPTNATSAPATVKE